MNLLTFKRVVVAFFGSSATSTKPINYYDLTDNQFRDTLKVYPEANYPDSLGNSEIDKVNCTIKHLLNLHTNIESHIRNAQTKLQ